MLSSTYLNLSHRTTGKCDDTLLIRQSNSPLNSEGKRKIKACISECMNFEVRGELWRNWCVDMSYRVLECLPDQMWYVYFPSACSLCHEQVGKFRNFVRTSDWPANVYPSRSLIHPSCRRYSSLSLVDISQHRHTERSSRMHHGLSDKPPHPAGIDNSEFQQLSPVHIFLFPAFRHVSLQE